MEIKDGLLLLVVLFLKSGWRERLVCVCISFKVGQLAMPRGVVEAMLDKVRIRFGHDKGAALGMKS